MTAQHAETALPRVPKSIAGIRAMLPDHRRAEFDAELVVAADSEDLTVIRRFRSRWWVLAAFETDPSLRELPDEEPMFASPFRR